MILSSVLIIFVLEIKSTSSLSPFKKFFWHRSCWGCPWTWWFEDHLNLVLVSWISGITGVPHHAWLLTAFIRRSSEAPTPSFWKCFSFPIYSVILVSFLSEEERECEIFTMRYRTRQYPLLWVLVAWESIKSNCGKISFLYSRDSQQ